MKTVTNVENINWEKQENLVPTIIQEENGTVLSLVYSNKESLEKTIETKQVWTYSRSRKGVFQKGASSKNFQKLVTIKTDCDSDSLLFIVTQEGSGGCHTGSYSCFGEEKKFTLQDLYATIVSRKNSLKEGSYTATLFSDNLLLKRKLVEESAEVITAKNNSELIWECADLIYFLFVIMAKEGITLADIERENLRRDTNKKEKEVNLV